MLLVPSWYPAHSEDIRGSFFRDQALALREHGIRVGVISVQLRPLKAWKGIFRGPFGVAAEVDAGIPTLRFYGVNWFPRMPRLRLYRRLWLHDGMQLFADYLMRYGEPDLLHAHSLLNGGVLAKSISERFGIPFVVTEHCSVFARGGLTRRQLALAEGVSASAARRLAVSRSLCGLLAQGLRGSAARWEEMPNVVDRRFLETKLPTPRRDGDPFVFLSVALLTGNKALHNLIRAFARAFGNDRNVVLRIGGDGAERPRLEVLAARLGVADRVQFLRMLSRERVREELSRAHVFALSSRYETFGVVIIEALASGKPVIATRCGGPESIVRERDGILVPVDDVPGYAEAMQRMRSGYADYDAMEIRAACKARYSGSHIAKRLHGVYTQVLAENGEKGG